jgi:hypothetical protein
VLDDVGAILIIAVFYSSALSLAGFGVLGLAAVVALQALGVRSPWAYVAPAAATWGGADAAGVHPTLAGVLVGLMTPARVWYGPARLLAAAGATLDALREKAGAPGRAPTAPRRPERAAAGVGLAVNFLPHQTPDEELLDSLRDKLSLGEAYEAVKTVLLASTAKSSPAPNLTRRRRHGGSPLRKTRAPVGARRGTPLASSSVWQGALRSARRRLPGTRGRPDRGAAALPGRLPRPRGPVATPEGRARPLPPRLRREIPGPRRERDLG